MKVVFEDYYFGSQICMGWKGGGYEEQYLSQGYGNGEVMIYKLT